MQFDIPEDMLRSLVDARSDHRRKIHELTSSPADYARADMAARNSSNVLKSAQGAVIALIEHRLDIAAAEVHLKP